MIIKGTSRANPKQLAAHLLRTDTNERVQILELNSPTDDLTATLRDWQLLTAATNGTNGLYHANISPAAGYTMTPEQWERAADALADELGLSHQPRAVILHEKEGREHIHVVWQRTDTDTMTLVSDSHNYAAHERASLALEQEFNHEHVPGKHAKRDREKQPEFPRAETNHAEWQQAERTGIDPHERKAQIIALKEASDSAQAFKTALEEAGYTLARGDRGYTLVDEQGDHFNLARQLKEKTAQVNTFMADVPLNSLPSLEEAKEQAKEPRQFITDIDPQTISTDEAAKSLQHELSKETPLQAPPKEQPEAARKPEPAAEPPKPQPDKLTPPQPHKAEDPQLARLEAALKERDAKEGRQLRERQKVEIIQLREVYKREADERLRDRRAVQEAELARFFRKAEEHSDDWVKKFTDIIKHRWNPQAAEQQRLARQQQIDAIRTRHRIDRDTLTQTMKLQRDQDIEELKQRHGQQIWDQAVRYGNDLQRFTREYEAAQKLLQQLEEQRRQEELDRKLHGPEPPKPSL